MDGAVFSDISAPRALDALLALPESDLSKFLDRTPRKAAIPDIEDELIEDEPVEDDDYEDGVIVNFGEMPLIYNNPKLSNDILLDDGGYDHLGSNELKLMVGDDNAKRIRRINAWRTEHIRPLDLKELNSADYSKFPKVQEYNKFGYLKDGSSDIHLSQIKVNPPTTIKQLSELKNVEHALDKLMHKDRLAGKNPYEQAPNCPYGVEQDLFLRYRNQISKETGLSYRAVSTALNRMLRKTIKWRATADRAIMSDHIPRLGGLKKPDHDHVWIRMSQWQMELDHLDERRKRYGPDWLRHDIFAWEVECFDKGYCMDFAWPHRIRYHKEFLA